LLKIYTEGKKVYFKFILATFYLAEVLLECSRQKDGIQTEFTLLYHSIRQPPVRMD